MNLNFQLILHVFLSCFIRIHGSTSSQVTEVTENEQCVAFGDAEGWGIPEIEMDETTFVTLTCPDATVIRINDVTALMNTYRQCDDDNSEGTEEVHLPRLVSSCNGKPSCTASVRPKFMQEHRRISNMMRIKFQCIPGSSMINICETLDTRAKEFILASPNKFIPTELSPDLVCDCVMRTKADAGLKFIYLEIDTPQPIGTTKDCGNELVTLEGSSTLQNISTGRYREFCGKSMLQNAVINEKFSRLSYIIEGGVATVRYPRRGFLAHIEALPPNNITDGEILIKCGSETPQILEAVQAMSHVTQAPPPNYYQRPGWGPNNMANGAGAGQPFYGGGETEMDEYEGFGGMGPFPGNEFGTHVNTGQQQQGGGEQENEPMFNRRIHDLNNAGQANTGTGTSNTGVRTVNSGTSGTGSAPVNVFSGVVKGGLSANDPRNNGVISSGSGGNEENSKDGTVTAAVGTMIAVVLICVSILAFFFLRRNKSKLSEWGRNIRDRAALYGRHSRRPPKSEEYVYQPDELWKTDSVYSSIPANKVTNKQKHPIVAQNDTYVPELHGHPSSYKAQEQTISKSGTRSPVIPTRIVHQKKRPAPKPVMPKAEDVPLNVSSDEACSVCESDYDSAEESANRPPLPARPPRSRAISNKVNVEYDNASGVSNC